MFPQPNPNNDAYNRETVDVSWRFHERYVAHLGPEVNPIYRPSLPLQISSQVTKGKDYFWKFSGGESK